MSTAATEPLAHDVDVDMAEDAPSAGAEPAMPSSSPPATIADLATATSSTATRKEPPPEKPSDTRRRTRVILSFWLIVLCIGLPIWWKTTAISRANLPLADMMDWADGKVSRVTGSRLVCLHRLDLTGAFIDLVLLDVHFL